MKNIRIQILIAVFMFGFPLFADTHLHRGRGNPWEYDAGPDKDSEILKIFNELPNYRTIGRVIMGKDQPRQTERFRWHWGPVSYRGRTGQNQVKVLIIGQEGGQDEAFSKRAFVGGTGQSMQHFLNYIGITRGYLFLNTFIYSIRGQYRDKELKLPNAYDGDYWMAQDLNSPIVQHRHRLFDHVVKINPGLRLIIAVGSGAKDTVQTWVKAHGGECAKAGIVESCDSSVLGKHIKLLGVKHPGMAGQAEGDTEEEEEANRRELIRALEADFQRAADAMAKMIYANPDWLPTDEDGQRPDITTVDSDLGKIPMGFETTFQYRNEPVPYRDLPFGHIWVMGRNSTRSNRSTDQRSITPFSDHGKYGDGSVRFAHGGTIRRTGLRGSRGEDSGYQASQGEVPYEPPRATPQAFDPGPGETWAKILMGGEDDLAWPDFNALGALSDPSFGTGALHRGRLENARVLIVADQQSHDDMMRGRALLGDGGQKIQHFLKQMGITQSYAIIRTLPVDTLGLSASKVRAISQNPQVVNVRSAILDKILSLNKTELILTVGPHAKQAIQTIDTGGIPIYDLIEPSSAKAPRNWTKILWRILKQKQYQPEIAPAAFRYTSKNWKETRLQINRFDLPFGTVKWFGTSGSLAERSTNKGGNYYQLSMPLWAAQSRATEVKDLTPSEIEGLRAGGWLDD